MQHEESVDSDVQPPSPETSSIYPSLDDLDGDMDTGGSSSSGAVAGGEVNGVTTTSTTPSEYVTPSRKRKAPADASNDDAETNTWNFNPFKLANNSTMTSRSDVSDVLVGEPQPERRRKRRRLLDSPPSMPGSFPGLEVPKNDQDMDQSNGNESPDGDSLPKPQLTEDARSEPTHQPTGEDQDNNPFLVGTEGPNGRMRFSDDEAMPSRPDFGFRSGTMMDDRPTEEEIQSAEKKRNELIKARATVKQNLKEAKAKRAQAESAKKKAAQYQRKQQLSAALQQPESTQQQQSEVDPAGMVSPAKMNIGRQSKRPRMASESPFGRASSLSRANEETVIAAPGKSMAAQSILSAVTEFIFLPPDTNRWSRVPPLKEGYMDRILAAKPAEHVPLTTQNTPDANRDSRAGAPGSENGQDMVVDEEEDEVPLKRKRPQVSDPPTPQVQIPASADATPSTTTTAPTVGTPLIPAKPAGWTCEACLVPNDAAASQCIACTGPKAGSGDSAATSGDSTPNGCPAGFAGNGGFKFGGSPVGSGGFQFGGRTVSAGPEVAGAAASSAAPSGGDALGSGAGGGFKFEQSVTKHVGFKFGGQTVSASLQSTTSVATSAAPPSGSAIGSPSGSGLFEGAPLRASEFSFGDQPNRTAAPTTPSFGGMAGFASGSGLTFGNSARKSGTSIFGSQATSDSPKRFNLQNKGKGEGGPKKGEGHDVFSKLGNLRKSTPRTFGELRPEANLQTPPSLRSGGVNGVASPDVPATTATGGIEQSTSAQHFTGLLHNFASAQLSSSGGTVLTSNVQMDAAATLAATHAASVQTSPALVPSGFGVPSVAVPAPAIPPLSLCFHPPFGTSNSTSGTSSSPTFSWLTSLANPTLGAGTSSTPNSARMSFAQLASNAAAPTSDLTNVSAPIKQMTTANPFPALPNVTSPTFGGTIGTTSPQAPGVSAFATAAESAMALSSVADLTTSAGGSGIISNSEQVDIEMSYVRNGVEMDRQTSRDRCPMFELPAASGASTEPNWKAWEADTDGPVPMFKL
ncbi:hypothetical protein HDV00_007570 [Rhizophlyctis rosea]|nr:hypothetical protein HDV00_007570 [Rhizophlyctis rosea]